MSDLRVSPTGLVYTSDITSYDDIIAYVDNVNIRTCHYVHTVMLLLSHNVRMYTLQRYRRNVLITSLCRFATSMN